MLHHINSFNFVIHSALQVNRGLVCKGTKAVRTHMCNVYPCVYSVYILVDSALYGTSDFVAHSGLERLMEDWFVRGQRQ